MSWIRDGDMTPKERMHAAMRFEEVDRVPVFTRHEAIARRALGISLEEWARDGEVSAKAQIAMTDLIGDDCIMAYIDSCVESDGYGQRTIFQRDEMPYSDATHFVIETVDDYYALEPYDIEAAPRIVETLKKVDVLVAERGETHSLVGEPYEPFVTLANLRGMERLLADCIKHPEAVKHALGVVTDVAIAYMRALVAHGCDVINICWDYGNPSIMSAKMWMDLEGDCMRRLYQATRDTGVWVSTHMCDSRPYIELALEIGNTDTIQNWAMPKGCADWAEFKEKYGRIWSITGGWNPVELNALSEEEVKAKSKDLIRVLGKGGGFVLSLACEFPYNGPIINGKAMVDASKEMAARGA